MQLQLQVVMYFKTNAFPYRPLQAKDQSTLY